MKKRKFETEIYITKDGRIAIKTPSPDLKEMMDIPIAEKRIPVSIQSGKRQKGRKKKKGILYCG